MKKGIKRWIGRHVGPKTIIDAKSGPDRHDRRNGARITRHMERAPWATKPRSIQSGREADLGRIRAALSATEGDERVKPYRRFRFHPKRARKLDPRAVVKALQVAAEREATKAKRAKALATMESRAA